MGEIQVSWHPHPTEEEAAAQLTTSTLGCSMQGDTTLPGFQI